MIGVERLARRVPRLIITALLWLILAGIIYFTDPESFGIIPIFFIILFITILFTSLLISHTRRALIIALSATFFLVLGISGWGTF